MPGRAITPDKFKHLSVSGFPCRQVVSPTGMNLVGAGASALDARNPGLIPQFKGIFGLVDQIVGSVQP